MVRSGRTWFDCPRGLLEMIALSGMHPRMACHTRCGGAARARGAAPSCGRNASCSCQCYGYGRTGCRCGSIHERFRVSGGEGVVDYPKDSSLSPRGDEQRPVPCRLFLLAGVCCPQARLRDRAA